MNEDRSKRTGNCRNCANTCNEEQEKACHIVPINTKGAETGRMNCSTPNLSAKPRPNALVRTEEFYITHEVDCLNCGTFFIPANQQALTELGIPPILANNFCGRTCYELGDMDTRKHQIEMTMALSDRPLVEAEPHAYDEIPEVRESSEAKQERLKCTEGWGVSNWNCFSDCACWNGTICRKYEKQPEEKKSQFLTFDE